MSCLCICLKHTALVDDNDTHLNSWKETPSAFPKMLNDALKRQFLHISSKYCIVMAGED